MKGTSAGTSADLLLMVRVYMCVPHLQVVFLFSLLFFFFLVVVVRLRHLTEITEADFREGCGQVEEVRRATKHSRERERGGGSTESDCDE